MKKNKGLKQGLSFLVISGTYIGTVVGSGFASGQEILQYFVSKGGKGLIGLILVTILFVVFGYIMMDIGKKLNTDNYLEIILFCCGKRLGYIMYYFINFFLFCALAAMLAGSGATLYERFSIWPFFGCLLMAGITYITVLKGFKGVVTAISMVAPCLIVMSIGVSLMHLYGLRDTQIFVDLSQYSEVNKDWLFPAILYVSYNIILAVAILGPLGKETKDHKALSLGAIFGGVGLGASAICIYLALISSYGEIRTLEIPMLFIAGSISMNLQLVYILILLAEIYTTAVSCLYGFVSSLAKEKDEKFKNYLAISIGLALIASQVGFSNLVKYSYAFVGVGGILFLIALVRGKMKLLARHS